MAVYRTFVQLDSYERGIIAQVRELLRKPNGKLPPQSRVVKAIIRDYWEHIKELQDQAQSN